MGDEAEKVATAPQATDREDEEWNLWKEREFIETLANQRLYFLLVFMGLIIAGATQAKSWPISLAIGVFGCIIVNVLSCKIYRSFKKIDHILCLIKTHEELHAVVQHWKHHEKDPPEYRSNVLLGKWIPAVCLSLLIVFVVITVAFWDYK